MMARAPLANPGVHFPPPILFILGFIGALLLDNQVRPLPFPGVGELTLEVFGGVVLLAGLYVLIWGIATFRRALTAIFPNLPASELVKNGPYRFTRNPMYLGLTIVFIGGAFIADSAWPLIVLPVVLGLLYLLVIRREEMYLADAFGHEYAAYCREVRRWL
jgi:protein-S-isoprenylcysteine O-methyltransferase Ste14